MTLNHPDFLGISLYHFFWTLSWCLGLGIFAKVRSAHHLSPAQTLVVGIGVLLSAIVGGRIFFFLNHPTKNIWQSFSFENGGLVLWGSILFSTAFVFLFSIFPQKTGKQSFGELLDEVSWSAAPSIALGRVGCFFQGCCHGRLCSMEWRGGIYHSPFLDRIGVTYHSPLSSAEILDLALVPVQLIESIGLLAVLILQYRLRKRLHPSFVFASFYAVLRFFLEFLRGDNIRGIWGPLSSAQWLCFGMMIVCLVMHLFKLSRVKKT